MLRYGTSLRLMASCSAFLNASTEFNEVDPETDWEKWSTRIPDIFTLFYAAIMDPTQVGVARKCIAASAQYLTDGPLPLRHTPHGSRLIVDYIACKKESEGRGFATKLVDHVRSVAAAKPANLYVLALEESCVWWMEKGGFVLEENENLNARLKVFPDVHLLRLAADPPDVGSPDDLALGVDDDEDEDVEQEEDDVEQEEEDVEQEEEDIEQEEEDANLATAVALSMEGMPNREKKVAGSFRSGIHSDI